jgi:hypothetical protein
MGFPGIFFVALRAFFGKGGRLGVHSRKLRKDEAVFGNLQFV